MNGSEKLYQLLEHLNIPFEYIEHPAAPTTTSAKAKNSSGKKPSFLRLILHRHLSAAKHSS
jgi:hypothetical protein